MVPLTRAFAHAQVVFRKITLSAPQFGRTVGRTYDWIKCSADVHLDLNNNISRDLFRWFELKNVAASSGFCAFKEGHYQHPLGLSNARGA